MELSGVEIDAGVGGGAGGEDARLPGKGNSNSHGTRPVHLIITMIKWLRTSRLSIKNLLSLQVESVLLEAMMQDGFPLLFSSLLLSSLALSDTQSLSALNTSPPRNRRTFL